MKQIDIRSFFTKTAHPRPTPQVPTPRVSVVREADTFNMSTVREMRKPNSWGRNQHEHRRTKVDI
jgi:hypothetical protein